MSPLGAKKCFTRWLRSFKGQKFSYFMVVEWHRFRDSVHIHALIGNTGDTERLLAMDRWYQKYGISRIWPYNSRLGARYYLGKYLLKDLSDWDIEIPLELREKVC
jgi:hypothetical protein